MNQPFSAYKQNLMWLDIGYNGSQTSGPIFKGIQKIMTPVELCQEIINQLDVNNKSILVMFNPEFVNELVFTYGIDPANIYFMGDEGEVGRKYGIVKNKMGVPDSNIIYWNPNDPILTKEEFGMKFDLCLLNPPFSKTNEGKTSGKRSVVLYPDFFNIAHELADVVAIVMPDTTNYVGLAEHNKNLINRNGKAHPVSDEFHKMMDIIIKTWYVIVNKNDDTPSNINFTTSKENLNILPIKKGGINLSTVSGKSEIHSEEFPVKVVKGMTRRGMELRFIKSHEATNQLPVGKYAVVFPLCVQPHGWSHCEIVQGENQCFNINTFYIEADTLTEAEEFKRIITSESFIAQANSLKGNSGTMGLEKFKKIAI